jgi:transcriptional regulator with XRE-family HTH domain
MAQSKKIHKSTKEIIKRIRKMRRDKDLSQEELANMSGIHRNHIGKLERLENSPSIDSLIKIAEALKIKLSKLFKDL